MNQPGLSWVMILIESSAGFERVNEGVGVGSQGLVKVRENAFRCRSVEGFWRGGVCDAEYAGVVGVALSACAL